MAKKAKNRDPNDLDSAELEALLSGCEKAITLIDPTLEKACLACILSSVDALDKALQRLQPADFAIPQYHLLYSLIIKLARSTTNGVDLVMAVEEANKLQVMGSLPDLLTLHDTPHKLDKVDEYFAQLVDGSVRRELHSMAVDLDAQTRSDDETQKILDTLMSRTELTTLRLLDAQAAPEDLRDIAGRLTPDILSLPPQQVWGLATGIAGGAYDELTGGVHKSQFWIVTGKTGEGKSWLTTSIGLGCLRLNPDAGRPLLVSTEMTKDASALRVLSILSGVPVLNLLRRDLSDDMKRMVTEAQQNFPVGLTMVSMARADIEAVAAVARQHKRKHGLPCMIVDMPAGLRCSKAGGSDDFAALSEISHRCAGLAQELDTALLGVVQQNRTAYNPTDGKGNPRELGKMGNLGGMKGTGAWGEDADGVITLSREKSGTTLLSLDKARHTGSEGNCRVQWDGNGGYRRTE